MAGQRIIVGLSGGVDSAVAALLLKEAGHQVEALFMDNWDDDDDAYCTTAEDYQDARAVCAELKIPLHKVSFAAEYKDRVFAYFLREYKAGRTPNPDVLCNREVKFKAMLDYALRLGAEGIATGHYARIDDLNGKRRLLRGLDRNKDQTYFLHTITQEQLALSQFPVGELPKPEVRAIAERAGLPVFNKRDSTGICFIGERDFTEFLQRYLPAQPGEIRDVNDQVIGEHQGLMYYTIGQRKGLGLGGRADGDEQPWYVCGKDLEHNILHVVQGHDHKALFASSLEAIELHWITGTVPDKPFKCTAKIRYRQTDQACELQPESNGRWQVHFDEPQRAITPGQWVVFYQDEACLGGGIID